MKKIILGFTLLTSLNVVACDLSEYNSADKALTKQIEKDDMQSASKASDNVLKVLKKLLSVCKGDAEVLKLQKTAIANDKTIKGFLTN